METPNKLLAGIGVFLVVLFVLAGTYKLIDDHNREARQLRAEDYKSCFQDEKYINAVTENYSKDGVITAEESGTLTNIKSEYYIKCINDIRGQYGV